MKTYRLVNLKDYALFVKINGETKTIPAKGYLIVVLDESTISNLKGAFKNSLKVINA